MKGICKNSNCGIEAGLGCDLGHPDAKDCPKFEPQTPSGEAGSKNNLASENLHRLPWTGRALGIGDLILATGRSSTSLVGLFGAFGAGKTSLLTSLFANLSKQGGVDSLAFSGSYSLQAWAQLKKHTEWPTSQGPNFPPHTPDSGERVPGLLHLAFRSDSGLIRDVLFTDAPGEWFTRWIRNQSSDPAKGARWIAEHSTHFLFFVDREALNGPEVGRVRQDILSMARILSEQRKARPVYVIWSKSDLTGNDSVEKPISEKLNEFFGPHESFHLHSGDPATLNLLPMILNNKTIVPERKVAQLHNDYTSAFLAYGQS